MTISSFAIFLFTTQKNKIYKRCCSMIKLELWRSIAIDNQKVSSYSTEKSSERRNNKNHSCLFIYIIFFHIDDDDDHWQSITRVIHETVKSIIRFYISLAYIPCVYIVVCYCRIPNSISTRSSSTLSIHPQPLNCELTLKWLFCVMCSLLSMDDRMMKKEK
jgi:hypothetical protein